MYLYIWPHPVGHVDLGDGTSLHRDETRHLGGNLAHALLGVAADLDAGRQVL